jgi:hypothetical protein
VCSGLAGVQFQAGVRVFFCFTMSRPALRSTQSHTKLVLELKQPGHEADYSPSTSSEVKSGGATIPSHLNMSSCIVLN